MTTHTHGGTDAPECTTCRDVRPGYYGQPPVSLGRPSAAPGVDIGDVWNEFMHYLYLPVRIPAHDTSDRIEAYGLPDRLAFLHDTVMRAIGDAFEVTPRLSDPYIYVTARRGFATPGNPLNRPGWHCDDFGGADLNYIWTDRYPTRFLIDQRAPEHRGIPIAEDDEKSMEDMAFWARQAELAQQQDSNHACRIEEAPLNHLLRLTPHVIHDTPVIPEPGGMRSFFKISVSTHRYNLRGNSHNHLLDYDWPMYDREAVRNQPGGNGDYVEERIIGHVSDAEPRCTHMAQPPSLREDPA